MRGAGRRDTLFPERQRMDKDKRGKRDNCMIINKYAKKILITREYDTKARVKRKMENTEGKEKKM